MKGHLPVLCCLPHAQERVGTGGDEARPTDAEVTAELHRVLCMNAKHRSRFTGQCSAGPNIARGLRARLRD